MDLKNYLGNYLPDKSKNMENSNQKLIKQKFIERLMSND